MPFIEASLFILFFAVISVPLANRLRLPLEIFLVIGSIIINLLPGFTGLQLNPIIVFELFLPPILFHAAYFTSWREFKLHLRPIRLLAFWLVLVTTVVVAFTIKLMIPAFSWATCMLLGAIISPTDASSATSIIKKLGAPRRLIAIIEGESLVNDATALLLYRFCIATILTGSFSLPEATLEFFKVVIGGAIIGLVIGIIADWIIRRLKDYQAETALTFITAFTCYLVADSLGVSAVISTVICGIYFGIRFPAFATSKTRINAGASWDTILFAINGFVFTLIGLELPWVLKNLAAYDMKILILYGAIISGVVVATRLLWIFLSARLVRHLIPSFATKDPLPSWQNLTILGWGGMRGIVSLAAALSIPLELSPGVPFPYRDLLIFLTYCTIIMTLIIPAVTLPTLLKYFNLANTKIKIKEEASARIHSLEAALERIEKVAKKEKIPLSLADELNKQIERQLKLIQHQLDETPYTSLFDEYFSLKTLTLAAIDSQREALLKLRREGDIHDDIFHRIFYEIDLEEMRIKSLRM